MRLLASFLVLLCLLQQHEVLAGKGFIRTKGLHFVENGYPLFTNGFNAYWLMSFAADPTQRSKVTTAFQEASQHGLTVARTWAFSDGGGSTALQYSPGSYNEQMFKGLDFVVSEAKRYKVRLILSLVNNYENFGGRKQYVEWARQQGQNIASDDQFFTNAVVKGYYKNHVKTVLTRLNTITGVAYKDDPTIFAWELMNEPRCQSDPSGNSIQAWITEMAAHVKSIDKNHLLEAGLEGFYAQSTGGTNPDLHVGTDFIANNQIPGIDFATLHSYPDQWLPNSNDQSQLAFLNTWLDTHIRDARRVLRKPLLLTEFGKSWKDSGYTNTQRDALFRTVYSKIYWSARTGGAAAGGLFWQLLTEGMESYRDGYEVILSQSSTTTGMITYESRKLHYIAKLLAKKMNGAKAMRAKAVRSQGSNTGN